MSDDAEKQDAAKAAEAQAAAEKVAAEKVAEAEAAAAKTALRPAPKAKAKADEKIVNPHENCIRVFGPAKGRWRIGRKFGPEATFIPWDELSDEDRAALAADPELMVGLA